MTLSSIVTLPLRPDCAAMMQFRPIMTLWADMHEIIDFGAFADHGVADAAAVDGGAGADLDVVVDDDAADLRNLS